MKFQKAIDSCHVRSAIYRKSNPDKMYWKNHSQSLLVQVPFKDHAHEDWEEYDPRDQYNCSVYG